MYGLYGWWRQAVTGRHRQADREYMRGDEVKSVLNNDERSVIDKDRRRRYCKI